MLPKIILTTANSRFSHTSMGLRYLRANLGEFHANSLILEFNLQSRPIDIVEKILEQSPDIIGFGVYIWNTQLIADIVNIIKTLAPEIIIILGGPEISYETEQQTIYNKADYVITGWGEISFYKLIKAISNKLPQLTKIIAGEQPALDNIVMPYREYNEIDLAQRTIYVEASRGCPFKCEFCLSALDKTAFPFPLDKFLAELEYLYQRGLRTFKFVDRTFNIKVETCEKILNFFLDKLDANPDESLFIHLEVVPDHLPERLKQALAKFPAQTIQLELGLQTLNLETQKLISRKTNLIKAKANIIWLTEQTNAHLHVDLIAGLPGEDLVSFAGGFDELWQWKPHEIQLGILKRLRGTPIIRHSAEFAMRYSPQAPYQVLATGAINFLQMQQFSRFARFWDMVANSGRFKQTLSYIMQTNNSPYQSFSNFVDYAYLQLNATHKIAYEKLWLVIWQWLLINYPEAEKSNIADKLLVDYQTTGMKGNPFNKININAETKQTNIAPNITSNISTNSANKSANMRQKRHKQ